MAAPEYVPAEADGRAAGVLVAAPTARVVAGRAARRARRRASPAPTRLGNQGPDQGYALKLVRLFDDKLHLTDGEHHEDAEVGCTGVALKRASIFGRAPVIHDLTIAFTVWGFLDERPPTELVELRKALFAEVRHPIHYDEQRAVVDAVPESTLRMTPAGGRRHLRARLAVPARSGLTGDRSKCDR